jgi:sugar lactone lactonase YvrE
MNGAGGPDLLARDTAGVLWLYPISGNAVFGARIRISADWNGYSILGPGDVSGDVRADILARDTAGSLWLYRGNGAGGVTARTLVGKGWQVMTALVTPGNWDRAYGNDVLARDSAGRV